MEEENPYRFPFKYLHLGFMSGSDLKSGVRYFMADYKAESRELDETFLTHIISLMNQRLAFRFIFSMISLLDTSWMPWWEAGLKTPGKRSEMMLSEREMSWDKDWKLETMRGGERGGGGRGENSHAREHGIRNNTWNTAANMIILVSLI